MQVQSLGQEDPLEKKIATHSHILAWESAWTEEPGGLNTRSTLACNSIYELGNQGNLYSNLPFQFRDITLHLLQAHELLFSCFIIFFIYVL